MFLGGVLLLNVINKKSFNDAVDVLQSENQTIIQYNFNLEAYCNYTCEYRFLYHILRIYADAHVVSHRELHADLSRRLGLPSSSSDVDEG